MTTCITRCCHEPEERKESSTHLVAPFDDSAGLHRAHAGRAQRKEVYSGLRHRKYGRAQARRVLAHRTFKGHQAKSSEKTAKPS